MSKTPITYVVYQQALSKYAGHYHTRLCFVEATSGVEAKRKAVEVLHADPEDRNRFKAMTAMKLEIDKAFYV